MSLSGDPNEVVATHTLHRVFGFTRPYRWLFLLSVFLSLLIAAWAPLRPFLIQVSINQGIAEGQSGFFLQGAGAFLLEITLIQLVLLGLETWIRFGFTFTSAKLGQLVVRDMRTAVFQKIIRLNLRQYDRTPVGTLTTRTVNDLESVNEIFSDGLVPIIADVLTIISILGYMFWMDWEITLICLSPFPILLIATYIFKESVKRSFNQVRNAVSALHAFVQERLSGMMVIQAFAAEQHQFGRFSAINARHRDANIRAIFAYSVFFPLVELVSALSIGMLVWWASRDLVDPAVQAKMAGLIASFILCLQLLFRPLRILADKFNVLQMGMIAANRVFDVLDNADTMPDQGIHKPADIRGDIRFDDVYFEYTVGQPVLQGLQFSVAAGQTLAIVGPTGSGKTSIIQLINRLYEPRQGRILIDDVPIEEFELAYLRTRIALVLQDVFLFSGTILDNITLRDTSISREEAIAAARQLGAHSFIEQLPGGYDFQVLERGGALSAGQRQLLAFVRAILHKPSILILDEATASIDQQTERIIQEAIPKITAGRTSIIIAHRLSTISQADQILVVDKGRMVEMGSHASLMEKRGMYFDMQQAYTGGK
ncbi:MAG: ABC transporter ATP-binding protein [Ferruginibacter sp.]